jgi:enoyl-CoA hydratase
MTAAGAEIIARLEQGVGRLTLNRPKALHALTTSMCEAMIERLQGWIENPAVKLVLIDHAGERGFCAGGDIRMLADSGASDGAEALRFFFVEYQLNALLMNYPKPICVIMDGVVMGGGVGLSMPARYRIATERTTFAMPETGIGLFPDVGGGWHLPRLPGETGTWLALTGARIKATDCLALGIATDFVPSDRLTALRAIICQNPAAIEDILAEFRSDPGPAPLAVHLDIINTTFAAASVEGVLEALLLDASDWALSQRAVLLSKSPQALKVAHRQLRQGRALTSFDANMVMEYRIGARVACRHDFLEGVRAVIVDKDDAARWDPPMLDGVTDAMLDEIFAPLPEGQEWAPIGKSA